MLVQRCDAADAAQRPVGIRPVPKDVHVLGEGKVPTQFKSGVVSNQRPCRCAESALPEGVPIADSHDPAIDLPCPGKIVHGVQSQCAGTIFRDRSCPRDLA